MARLNRIILTGWTVLAGAVGLRALARRRWSGRRAGADDGTLSVVSVFEDSTRRSTTSAFRGGSVVSVFGRSHLDLRRASMAPDGASLRVLTAFGDTEITLPEGWRVTIDGPALAGAGRLTSASPQPETGPVLTISARTVFGLLDVARRPVVRTAPAS